MIQLWELLLPKQVATVTLWPCSLLFNVQVMILVGSSGFFTCASTSVDGCYLYIIIHYGMSQRDWGIRLVPRGGRPGPESLKAIDTYTYHTIHITHINSPYVSARMCLDCPYEDGSSSSPLIVNEWTGLLVLIISL